MPSRTFPCSLATTVTRMSSPITISSPTFRLSTSIQSSLRGGCVSDEASKNPEKRTKSLLNVRKNLTLLIFAMSGFSRTANVFRLDVLKEHS